MATIKITCYFSQAATGWTESYYITDADALSGMAAFRTVWKYRAYCLASTVVWRNVRSEQIGGVNPTVTEDSSCRRLTKVALAGDTSVNGVEMLFRSADGYQRNLIMRGFPDLWIKRRESDSTLVVTGDLVTAMDDWILKIKGLGPVVIGRTKVADGGTKVLIDDFEAVQGNSHQLDVVSDLAIPGTVQPGMKIQVGGCRNIARAANGIYVVQQVPDVNVIRVQFIATRIAGLKQKDIKRAFWRPYGTSTKSVTTIVRRYVKTKKTGRVAGTPKGRATR